MGGFVWTGFDYRGEPTPFAWPNISSHFGVMDVCGFPKNVYYSGFVVAGDVDFVHIDFAAGFDIQDEIDSLGLGIGHWLRRARRARLSVCRRTWRNLL